MMLYDMCLEMVSKSMVEDSQAYVVDLPLISLTSLNSFGPASLTDPIDPSVLPH